MREIQPADVIGARITDVHARSETIGDYNCTYIYLTIDRGLTFMLPAPGERWLTATPPPDASRLEDTWTVDRSGFERVVGGWREVHREPEVVDVIARLKRRTIARVCFYKTAPRRGWYYPGDAAVFVFDDGSQMYRITTAAIGLSAEGLYYLDDPSRLESEANLVDFAEVPLKPPRNETPSAERVGGRLRLWFWRAAIAFSLLCLATIAAAWVRSERVADEIALQTFERFADVPAAHRADEHVAYYLRLDSGSVIVRKVRGTFGMPLEALNRLPTRDEGRRWTASTTAPSAGRMRGFASEHFSFFHRGAWDASDAYSVPLWLPAMACLVAPGLSLAAALRRRRRRVRVLCARCGYDLRASPERCPECGRSV